MSAIRVLHRLEPSFAWDGARLYLDGELGPDVNIPEALRGAAAVVECDAAGRVRIFRDVLGINKLFWARDVAGGIVMAANPSSLLEAGIPFERVFAIPPGCVVDVDPRVHMTHRSLAVAGWRSSDVERTASPAADGAHIDAVGSQIRTVLDGYLGALAAALPAAQVFVCLSGGLDSSGIAVLARRHFPSTTAVSFDLARAGGATSEDRRTALRLAADLGMPLLDVTVTEDELFSHLDSVLVHGIDWRDFNVHAGLVNAALAARINAAAESAGDGRRLVLTGDLANELVADYHPEQYRGRTYYDLPRLRPGALRRILVRGLATSHRETGVFGAWGLETVQPYAVAVDAYMSLPDGFFECEEPKQQLARATFGDEVPDYVYARKKTRAQVGDAEAGGGVLAAAIDRGIDGQALRRRFAVLHGLADERQLDRFLRAGHYRSAIPFADEEA